jgi:tetratricopeptide (TPR) repeat protein
MTRRCSMRVALTGIVTAATLLATSVAATAGTAVRCPDGTMRDSSAYEGRDLPAGFCGGGNGGYVQPPVDPSIAQAAGLNEAGRAAFAAQDYDRAADYFRKAFATHPDPAFKDNELSTLSSQHFDRGVAAFDAKNWQFAIDEFQRAISLRANPAAEENIRLARSQIAWAAYAKALTGNRLDEAELFLREADKWDHNPDLAADLRQIRLLRAEGDGRAAFAAGDYARAEAHFAQALALDPKSPYANRMYADCIAREALALVGHESLHQVTAVFDRALQAYLHGVQAAGAEKSLVQSLAWARHEARRTLEGLAASPADWADVIRAHERWAAAAGADPGATRELANIKAAGAGETLRRGGTSADDIHAAERGYAEALQADPTNQRARDGHVVAARQTKALTASQDIVRGMTDPGARAIEQADRARRAMENPDPRCPWDTATGCVPGGTIPGVAAPSSQFAFASAAEETPEQRELHPQVDAAQAEVGRLTKELGESKDPMQHVAMKTKLAKSEQALGIAKEDYKKAGKTHHIAPRGPTGAAPAGAEPASDATDGDKR